MKLILCNSAGVKSVTNVVCFLFIVKARPGLYDSLERLPLLVGEMDECGVVPEMVVDRFS